MRPLLIDTGPSSSRVANRIAPSKIFLVITHSHSDHIGGLSQLLRTNKVQKIFIPYYLPEVVKISQILRKYSKKIITTPNWKHISSIEVELVADGSQLCDHINVLNPPKSIYKYQYFHNPGDRSIEEALSILRRRELILPVEDIINYRSPLVENGIISTDTEYSAESREFTHRFFISLSFLIQSIDLQAINYFVTQQIDMTANQTSIVFKYNHQDGNWLFTGDADELVFERLIAEGKDLSSRYLKVPHHGSRENLSKKALEKINPEYAIISHNNRKFGRSLDRHPHHEVIDRLDLKGVKTFYTNPVIKQKKIIKPQTIGSVLNGLINFV